MWKHATDFPPKASLWQLSQQYSPNAAVGLQAETTAVTASHGSSLSEVFPFMYGMRLGETGHTLKKREIQAVYKGTLFLWTVIYRSRLLLRAVLQPSSLVIPKPSLSTESHKKPARILHLILLGAGDWATDLLWFLLPWTILWSHECL